MTFNYLLLLWRAYFLLFDSPGILALGKYDCKLKTYHQEHLS